MELQIIPSYFAYFADYLGGDIVLSAVYVLDKNGDCHGSAALTDYDTTVVDYAAYGAGLMVSGSPFGQVAGNAGIVFLSAKDGECILGPVIGQNFPLPELAEHIGKVIR